MRLYYITCEALDPRSVAMIHTDAICNNLTILGHSVLLFAPNSGEFEEKSYQVKSISTPRKAVSVFFQIKLFFRLRREIRNNRSDIIYIRNSQLLFMPAIVSRIFKIPLILEANGKILEEIRQVKSSFLSRILLAVGIYKFIESFNVKTAKKIIVVTEGIKEYFVENYKTSPDKIEVVANGVDTEFFKPMAVAEARRQIGLSNVCVSLTNTEPIYIGYTGSFYSWQGLRYIAEAAKIVAGKRLEAKFLIVGSGDERDYLTSFVKDNNLENSIEIRPAVSHDLVPLYTNALDICLCYPTKFRAGATSPFKVYQYLACGKAVILADIDGMREEFGDAVSYVEPESSSALAEKIISLIDDAESRKRLGSLGRQFVEQGRSWRAVAEKIERICEKAIKRL